MRLRLLDVNVLLALAWPNHPFHEIARSWFVLVAKQGWASCLLIGAQWLCCRALKPLNRLYCFFLRGSMTTGPKGKEHPTFP
jgi:hypothetical protein